IDVTGSLLIEKNFIHNLGLSTTSVSAAVYGIMLYQVANSYITVKNNMIQLGINPNGSANVSGCKIFGILPTNARVDSILYNSVYIGGAPAAATGNTYAYSTLRTPSLTTREVCLGNIFFNARSGGTTGKHYAIDVNGTTKFPLGFTGNYNLIIANGATGGTFGRFNSINFSTFDAYKDATGTEMASGSGDPNFIAPTGNSSTANLRISSPTPVEGAGIVLASVTDDYNGNPRSGLTPSDVGADAGNFTISTDVFGPNITCVPIGNGTTTNRSLTNWATITDNVGVSGGASAPRIYYKKTTDVNAFVGNTSADNGWKFAVATNNASPYSFIIDYSNIFGGSVAINDIIQYFVVAQDAVNNLSSNNPMAGASGIPPVENISACPAIATIKTYLIVPNAIPTTITVPGTYATLTGTDGAFDMINKGVLTGNTIINITDDLTEPGTVALNTLAEDIPGANYTLLIKPDASVLRTISGTAVASATAMIRTNGACRFTIDGGAGKLLTFRNTNAVKANTGPTIQFNNSSQYVFITNCTIENNGSTTTRGSIDIGSTGVNVVEISGNNIGNATANTPGNMATGIYNSNMANSVKVMNNNIYNFISYGLYFTNAADGVIITGNSFYYNSATATGAMQYCIWLAGGMNNNTISNNYFGGGAPLCGGVAWTNSSGFSFYGMNLTLGIIMPTTISNNSVQNVNMVAGGFYGMNITAGLVNIENNMIGSTTVPGSITFAGTSNFFGAYLSLSTGMASSIQGNTFAGLNFTNPAAVQVMLLAVANGLVKIGDVAPNTFGSRSIPGSITYTGIGIVYGLWNFSSIPGNLVENNILGNWSLTGMAGSPTIRGLYVYSADVRKNTIFSISAANANLTPTIVGLYNFGAPGVTNEYSNNLVSLDGGLSTNPFLYGFYGASFTNSFYNLYYNDFYISGPATGTSNTSAFYREVAGFYTLKNNIFANLRAAGGTGKHYATYLATTGAWNSDNNDLYSLAGPLGYYNAADQMTMASWKTISGGDANSQNVDPQFISSIDLHTIVPELHNTGISIPTVTTDYSGATRGNPPDIGAYEGPASPDVITTTATDVTDGGATMNGTVNANSLSTTVTFEYGLTTAYGSTISANPDTVTGSTVTPVSASVSKLLTNATYHFRAKGVSISGVTNGNDMTFTTGTSIPTDLTVSGTIHNDTCFNATNTITVAGTPNVFVVTPTGSVTMIAGATILYLPGTTVQPGGYLHGYISTGTYCSVPSLPAVAVIAGRDKNLFNISNANFTIYPNPTTGNFTLVQKGDKL
ncbi:MAG: beta strand repeat-containing protein, partial [Bacteroidales bacterium]